MPAQPTEVWFRNPLFYIRELIECDQADLTFDLGSLQGRGRDPFRFLSLHMPAHLSWRLMVMDDIKREVNLYLRDTGSTCVETYPMWMADQSYSELDDLLDENDRVVVLNPGVAGYKQFFLEDISEIQEGHTSILHYKNSSSYRDMFGLSFKAVDIESRSHAARQQVITLGGERAFVTTQANRITRDAKILGFNMKELEVPRNRCIFNIKSALYASKYFKDQLSPKLTRTNKDKDNIDYETSNFRKLEIKTPRVKLPKDPEKREEAASKGNFFLCNSCALQLKCDYFRQGAVCSVPGSEPTELANFFGSRDAEVIKLGLSNLLMFESNRVMQAAEKEHNAGEIDPELTKMVHGLFDRGVKMVKLQDPDARGGVKLNFNMGVPSPGVASGPDPKVIIGNIIAELEGRGIPRDMITREMIAGIISNEDKSRAIEGVVIASKTVT